MYVPFTFWYHFNLHSSEIPPPEEVFGGGQKKITQKVHQFLLAVITKQFEAEQGDEQWTVDILPGNRSCVHRLWILSSGNSFGPTELEAPPKGHAVPQQAPLRVRSGSQLSVDSKQLRAFLRSNTVATPRMYSMEQHHHHRHHHCHHNLHLGRRNVWYFQPRVSCCLPWYNWCNWCMLCKGHKSSDKHITHITSWL